MCVVVVGVRGVGVGVVGVIVVGGGGGRGRGVWFGSVPFGLVWLGGKMRWVGGWCFLSPPGCTIDRTFKVMFFVIYW